VLHLSFKSCIFKKTKKEGELVYRIAIVEDEQHYRETLEGYLLRYEKENNITFEVTTFTDGDEITQNFKPIFDIIFLDIEMKFMDGMETAEYIRQYDKNVILIFITNMSQYAVKGYSVDALSYLLKPVPYFAFSQELVRSIKQIEKRDTKYMMIKTQGNIIKINIDDILFIESNKHRLIIHTYDEEHFFVGTMKDMEEKLQNNGFYRCNSGYLVNLTNVTGVKDNLVLIGKHQLQISRPRKKSFLDKLTQSLGGLT